MGAAGPPNAMGLNLKKESAIRLNSDP